MKFSKNITNLSKEIVENILTEVTNKKIVVIYPGRFQPMGKHHAAVSKWIDNTFANADTFVATTDKVEYPTSPFNFKEKQEIAKAYGVTNLVKVKNPYSPQEILNNYNPDNTILLIVVGDKDMKENPRFTPGYKKDGTPSYYQLYEKNKTKLDGFDKHGYLVVAPHISLTVSGKDEMSGSTLRKYLSNPKLSIDKKKEIFRDSLGLDPEKYKKVFDLIINKLAMIKESKKNILQEGGGAGHMSHVVEDTTLTFSDLKTIIKRALDGELGVEEAVQEKTDGQNSLVTFKNGKVGMARNKTTILNPMSVEEVANKFEGRGAIKDAFVKTLIDLESALLALPKDFLEKYFKNGKVFMNVEILYPATKNVINYGQNSFLQIHGTVEFDENGNKVAAHPKAGVELEKAISSVNAQQQKTFKIIPPIFLTLKRIPQVEEKIKSYYKELNNLQKSVGITDNDTILDYYYNWWKKYITEKLGITDSIIIDGLANRWSGKNKTLRLNNQTFPDANTLNKIKMFDAKEAPILQEKLVESIENLILRMSVDVLSNATNFLAANPTESNLELRKDLANALQQINKNGNSEDLIKVQKMLNKIEIAGGMDKIIPSEGLVFVYNGKTYKLTGTFTPVHKILSMLVYGDNKTALTEGGNIPGVNSMVPKEYLESTVQNGLNIFGFKNLKYSIVGNKNKPVLGDVDIAVESKQVGEIIGNKNPELFWDDLTTFLKKANKKYKVSKGLSQFNLLVPVSDNNGKQLIATIDRDGTKGTEPGICQIDVMVGNLNWMKDALSGATNSNYKAVYRNLFLADILSQLTWNSKTPGLKRKLQLNSKEGIEVVDYKLLPDGKKEKVKIQKIATTMDAFAKILFGKDVLFNNIDTFEKVFELFNSDKFRFPRIRKNVINAFKKTLESRKLSIPNEIK